MLGIVLCSGTLGIPLLHLEHEGGVLVGMGVAVGNWGMVLVSHPRCIGFCTWLLVFCVGVLADSLWIKQWCGLYCQPAAVLACKLGAVIAQTLCSASFLPESPHIAWVTSRNAGAPATVNTPDNPQGATQLSLAAGLCIHTCRANDDDAGLR